LIGGSFLIGIASEAVLVMGVIVDPPQFFRAYLAAYLCCLNIALGGLVLLMIYHVTGGVWGFLLRRIFEACAKTLPLLAVGFVPIALGAKSLYLWAQPEAVASNELLQQQSIYMNPGFWIIRAAAYFLLWNALAFFLCRWSRLQDKTANPRIQRWLNGLSGIGLMLYGVTMHFAAVDWIISLQPEFHSTIIGPLLASQQLLSGFAFAIIVLALLSDREHPTPLISAHSLNDLGTLLLTFVVLWGYMWWFEFMLIWIANLPVDVIWYVDRVQGGWLWLVVALAVFGFAAPFLLLLQRGLKRNLAALLRIAALVLFFQLAFTHWQILPAFQPAHFGDCWMSAFAPSAIGGIWLAVFLGWLKRAPLLALNDNNALALIRLRKTEEWETQWEDSLAHG
jgi:hypothetical protein